MIRFLDLVISLIGLFFGAPLLLLLLVVGWADTGSPLFRQIRVGRHRRPFTLVKFRTMRLNSISVATHLADASDVTALGVFLRRTKLDEFPQLWNVLKGEMSLVGPRPCLFSQSEVIAERDVRGVFAVRPGVTGLAQVSGIDMSTPKLLAEIDFQMLQDFGAKSYFFYIFKTLTGAGRGDRIGRDIR